MNKHQTNPDGYIVALDVGERRIGVAVAHTIARLATPLKTLVNDDSIWEQLTQLLDDEQAMAIVVGWPRGMSGQETAQTHFVRTFVDELSSRTDLPIHLQDEAVTSVQAEQELQTSGRGYNKAMVDAQAAAIILQDYLQEQPNV